jgi:hypothetical protein
MKFNCFFLKSFMDSFPEYLRNELARARESGLTQGDMFDLKDSRRSLQDRRSQLLNECASIAQLKNRFNHVQETLRNDINVKNDSEVSTSEGEVTLD